MLETEWIQGNNHGYHRNPNIYWSTLSFSRNKICSFDFEGFVSGRCRHSPVCKWCIFLAGVITFIFRVVC